jgi:hypothetical protein
MAPVEPGPRRGRPPKQVPDYLRAMAWYHAVATRTGAGSSYALEKLFADDNQKARIALGVLIGSWRKYLRGRLPRRELVDLVEQRYPGTRMWLELPLWELLKVPSPSLERVRQIVLSLRPDVAELVIKGEHFHVYGSVLKDLRRKADVEAMIGCMAVIRLTEHRMKEGKDDCSAVVNQLAATICLRILMHLAVVERPFAEIFRPLFDYLNVQFAPFADEPLDASGFEPTVRRMRLIAMVLQAIGILDARAADWRAYLHGITSLYEPGLDRITELFVLLADLAQQRQLKKARSLPTVKKLVRRIKSVPRIKSCLDESLTSFTLPQNARFFESPHRVA